MWLISVYWELLYFLDYITPNNKKMVFALTPQYCVLRGEVTNTNVIIFGLTRRGLEPTIYRTPGEHTSHYTTDAGFYYIFLYVIN
jgi:hypothetical protein